MNRAIKFNKANLPDGLWMWEQMIRFANLLQNRGWEPIDFTDAKKAMNEAAMKFIIGEVEEFDQSKLIDAAWAGLRWEIAKGKVPGSEVVTMTFGPASVRFSMDWQAIESINVPSLEEWREHAKAKEIAI